VIAPVRRALASRLALRLALVLVSVTAVGMLVMALYVSRAWERYATERLETVLTTSARVVHEVLIAPPGGGVSPEELQRLVERYGATLGVRVTVIAADGTVLGDSERDRDSLRQMENHVARPEVRTALAGGTGRDVRRSRTLNVEMLYVAIPLEGPTPLRGVVRVAVPLTEVARTSHTIRRAVEGGAVLAIGVALVVALLVSRPVTRPVRRMRAIAQRMAEGHLDARVPVTGSDEIGQLGDTLNQLAEALREKIESLETERAEIAAILERMVEGVMALDARGRILIMNPAARAIFGIGDRRDASVEGRPFLEVVRQKALFDLVEACRADAPRGQCQREVEVGPPIRRTLLAHAVTVGFARQGPGTVLVLHDVTELRRLERVRAEFVANVSHELRTPLTSITGYLETLLGGAIDEPAHARRFLEIANTHAQRLGRLVDDLLQLSNAETGKVVLHLESIVLRETTEGVAAMFEGNASAKGLTITNRVAPDLRVRADRDRLAQILVNLVDNAVKYTPDGGHVTLDATPQPVEPVEVTVADTGVGIPSIDLPRISERFYRVDKARSRELGGTGLGLAIVKHLVHAHGGTLRIESELGKGTAVRFTLPSG
jgi:two-component system phosphate regulon sensor histidine kinase PhoR